ncbi:caspase family protein [Sulfurimonas diazotrophicus]|uniref:Caspase family protein n=1 Tax=Sulfurimonas diazotrophicus TaxID=3131939 RepID=A0ABZ3H6Q7_9BACT
MRRRALIIGAPGKSQEYLPGVRKDVENYTNFLTSNIGGKWLKDEIVSLYDQDINTVQRTINLVKSENNDFVLVVFSGHGNYSAIMSNRRLYIDHDNYIYEDNLKGLSKKELLIIDTCAGIEREVGERKVKKSAFALFRESYTDYRKKYEDAILSCLDQEIVLYASDVDEYSADTSKGGLYSKNLLETAYNNSYEEVLSSLVAHDIASSIVRKESKNKQNPQYSCSVRKGNKLPFALKEL